MFVQLLRSPLYKDVLKPRNRKLRFKMSEKAAAFNSNKLRRKKFDTEVFRGKYTVVYPGYEFEIANNWRRYLASMIISLI